MHTRICLISTVGRLDDPRFFHRYAALLKQNGFDVSIVLRGDAHTPSHWQDIPLHAVTFSSSLKSRVINGWRLFHEALRHDADIYQFFEPEFLPWGLALKAATKAAVVYDSREDNPAYLRHKTFAPKPVLAAASLALSSLEGIAGHMLDGIITADAGTAERLQKHARHLAVMHNFPPPWFIKATQDAAIPWQQRSVDILYHGALPRYNADALLQTLALLHREHGIPATMRIVSRAFDIHPGYEKELRREAEKLGIDASVELLHALPYNRMPALVNDCRVGLIPLPPMPKFFHNIPQKLFEFMAAGIPTVVSDLPPVRPFIAGKRVVMAATPGDPAAYAQAVASLLRNPQDATNMGARALAHARATMSMEDELQNALALYRRIKID